MIQNVFAEKNVVEAFDILVREFPLAIYETVYVTLLSTLFSLIIGMPIGLLLAAGDLLRVPRPILAFVSSLINLLRSVPFLIIMMLAVPLTRLIASTAVGTFASIVPLVIASFPFVARLVESSIREVDPNIVEAAQSMGASPFQIVARVLVPESVPSLISGTTIAFTTILGYSAMSGIIGGGGLGKIAINYGYYRYKTLVMIFAVIALVLLVFAVQAIGDRLAKRMDKRLR